MIKNKKLSFALAFIGILLISLNLRDPIVGISPILGNIENILSISPVTAGLLTTIPLIVFAIFSPFISHLTRKKSMEYSLFISLLLILIGTVTRSHSDIVSFLVGTAVLGLGITVSNVILPSLVKKEFSNHIAIVTSLYVFMMGFGSWISTSLAIPVMNFATHLGFNQVHGLQVSLLSMIVFPVIAIVFWLPQLSKKIESSNETIKVDTHSYIWRSKIAWQITLFFGLNALFINKLTCFYINTSNKSY